MQAHECMGLWWQREVTDSIAWACNTWCCGQDYETMFGSAGLAIRKTCCLNLVTSGWGCKNAGAGFRQGVPHNWKVTAVLLHQDQLAPYWPFASLWNEAMENPGSYKPDPASIPALYHNPLIPFISRSTSVGHTGDSGISDCALGCLGCHASRTLWLVASLAFTSDYGTADNIMPRVWFSNWVPGQVISGQIVTSCFPVMCLFLLSFNLSGHAVIIICGYSKKCFSKNRLSLVVLDFS